MDAATAATEVSAAGWWREKVVELRQVADRTADADLRRRLLALADRWDDFAADLDYSASRAGFR
jgi:hypothetical protein